MSTKKFIKVPLIIKTFDSTKRFFHRSSMAVNNNSLRLFFASFNKIKHQLLGLLQKNTAAFNYREFYGKVVQKTDSLLSFLRPKLKQLAGAEVLDLKSANKW